PGDDRPVVAGGPVPIPDPERARMTVAFRTAGTAIKALGFSALVVFKKPVDNPPRLVVSYSGLTQEGRADDDRRLRYRIRPVAPGQGRGRARAGRPVRPAPRPAQADGAAPPGPPPPGPGRPVRRHPGGTHRGPPPRRRLRPRALDAR